MRFRINLCVFDAFACLRNRHFMFWKNSISYASSGQTVMWKMTAYWSSCYENFVKIRDMTAFFNGNSTFSWTPTFSFGAVSGVCFEGCGSFAMSHIFICLHIVHLAHGYCYHLWIPIPRCSQVGGATDIPRTWLSSPAVAAYKGWLACLRFSHILTTLPRVWSSQ